ncbi:spore coat protein GerQ [Heyndrickxia ginsengihumi]|uniref:Spore coat protein GerQ n=1 Tax=Heyndrickxia ginsengihumi TaxID=363870 RepID=A0A0A6Y3A4_9BACI|nr:spore gernimation protein GerQ [Heyndrickxia ginsengihumi]MBE6184002.1 spore coat protein GerQ [Bacillus sp. (in: firmicutes)]NEY18443.1 spore coat protein GerQ [Heyndrickxia ginsengihumi]
MSTNYTQPVYGYPYYRQTTQPNYGGGYYQQQYQMPFPQQTTTPTQNLPGQLPLEQSYIENILRLNKGKLVTLYATFENNREWNAKVFKGIIEAAGRDHVILSNPETGERYLIPMVYVDYVTFSEEIEYEYPYGAAPSTQQLATYPPRGE